VLGQVISVKGTQVDWSQVIMYWANYCQKTIHDWIWINWLCTEPSKISKGHTSGLEAYDYVLGQVLPVNDPPVDWSQLNLYWTKKCQ